MKNSKEKNEYLEKWRSIPENRQKMKEASKRWAKNNPRRGSRIRTDRAKEYDSEYRKKYYAKNQKELNESSKEYARRRRLICLAHYSVGAPSCACCGEKNIEFLALDHIAGGGTSHRKSIRNMVPWIIRNDFPPIFRVLCHNCNQSNGYYGYCPHASSQISSSKVT